MSDRLTTEQRGALMARISGKDTKPELFVRRLLHAAGYRYRLHARELAGRPDIVFRRRRKAIFVHGCFWHSHPGCRRAGIPATRAAFWEEKLRRNRERDLRVQDALCGDGWDVLIVWECSLRDPGALKDLLLEFMDRPHRGGTVLETTPWAIA